MAEVDWRAFAYQIKLQRQSEQMPSVRELALRMGLSSTVVQRACSGDPVDIVPFLVLCKYYTNNDPRVFLKG